MEISTDQDSSFLTRVANFGSSTVDVVISSTKACYESISGFLGNVAEKTGVTGAFNFCATLYKENSKVSNIALGAIALGAASLAAYTYSSEIKNMISGDASSPTT